MKHIRTFEKFIAKSPKGMDVGLYEYIKRNFKNTKYEITYVWGMDNENLDNIEFGVGDEENFLDDTYVNINDTSFTPTEPGQTNTIIDFYANDFNIKLFAKECKGVRKYDEEFYTFIKPIINDYKNSIEYQDWKMFKDTEKYNI